MANSWMKLYHETLNDPKMGTMSDHLYRRTIELFLLAGQEDRNGILPPVPQMAWALRTTVQDMTICLQELTELGIISRDPETGAFLVTHFAERQDSNLSVAERVAKHRENMKREERYTCNADDVTPVTEMKREERYTCNADANAVANADANAEYVSNANAVNVTDVTPDKDIDKEEDKDKEEELINININIPKHVNNSGNAAAKIADRGAGSKKPQKADPSNPEFWQRAFGPEADRARAFSSASGIIPLSGEFGRWQKELRSFTEAGISIDQMTRAVKKVRKDGRYPIKAPGTVLTEARNLAAVPAAKTTADYLEGITWEGCDDE